MIAGWSPQGFTALRENGAVVVAGWVKGPFALDFRPFHWSLWDTIPEETAPFVWVLTHLPTGYGVMAVADAFAGAAGIADELASVTDWSIVTVESSRWFERRVRELFARYPERIYSAEQTITPWVEREADA